jgi:hypothetical protein
MVIVLRSHYQDLLWPPPEDFRRPPLDFLREAFRAGTFPPLCRASLRPMAIACFRLLTRLPELLFSVPFLRRCIADFTRFCADLPYLAIEPLFALSM